MGVRVGIIVISRDPRAKGTDLCVTNGISKRTVKTSLGSTPRRILAAFSEHLFTSEGIHAFMRARREPRIESLNFVLRIYRKSQRRLIQIGKRVLHILLFLFSPTRTSSFY